MAFLQSLGAHSGPREPPINPTSFSPFFQLILKEYQKETRKKKTLLLKIKDNDQ